MDPLKVPPEALGRDSGCRFEVVADMAALTEHFATTMIDELMVAREMGRSHVVYIVPVGPVGQFERFAELCNEMRLPLSDLVLINMDEYLTPAGDYIPLDDALSFRSHMERALWSRLDPALAPPVVFRHFPDPHDPQATNRLISALGGVDVAFGGVGITGHLAFNDPPEPGEVVSPDEFAALPTRVVALNGETRTIYSVTACRGNIERIPMTAVKVGM
jgi:glucosamine-6-phosphate deaminase